ncbi:MAG: hypothetical protein J5501_11470 [Ruminococcus sp.]|nr:hypothetical protein [Ruminococcus sp.]
MKNRKKLRQMTVNGDTYLWAYYYDPHDIVNYPSSYYLFVPKENERLKVRVHCMCG